MVLQKRHICLHVHTRSHTGACTHTHTHTHKQTNKQTGGSAANSVPATVRMHGSAGQSGRGGVNVGGGLEGPDWEACHYVLVSK